MGVLLSTQDAGRRKPFCPVGRTAQGVPLPSTPAWVKHNPL